jgi:hypothetical protein
MCSFRCAMVAAVLALLSLQTPASKALDTAELNDRQRDTLAYARAALKEKRYADAYGKFAQLADEGHGPSAEMAMAMVLHGRMLFDQEWSATPGQQRRWTAMSQQRARQHDFKPETEPRE